MVHTAYTHIHTEGQKRMSLYQFIAIVEFPWCRPCLITIGPQTAVNLTGRINQVFKASRPCKPWINILSPVQAM